jgi:IS5 family transposase
MRRCHLKGALGDAMNPVLAAAGYNLRWLMRWIIAFWAQILVALLPLTPPNRTAMTPQAGS